ncbi:MAG: hypothetical protein RLN69_09295 [Woeseiaceae bacterium]
MKAATLTRPAEPSFGPGIAELEAGLIDPEQFDHQAHVFVAWSYLAEYPLAESIQRFTAALRRLTVKLGASDKYHETITWFYLIEIEKRRNAETSRSWPAFVLENADLLRRGGDVLRQHYSPALLASPLAREKFVLPDLPQSPA